MRDAINARQKEAVPEIINTYLARNLAVCKAYGLAAALTKALKTLKDRSRTPHWLLTSLEGMLQSANCLIHPLVRHRDEVSPHSTANVFDKIDWKLLGEQKTTLAELQSKSFLSQRENEALEGILNLLDAIQDHAENIAFNE